MAITHRNLDYESKERRKLNIVVPFLSQKLYELDKALGKHRVDDCVWTYTVGLTFRDLTESEMKTVKKVFGISELKKDISEYGVKFYNSTYDTGLRIDDRPITLSVEFRWDLPETCEIEYVENWVECQDEVKQGDDGKFLLKEINTKVNCGESTMMKAIFKPQVADNGM